MKNKKRLIDANEIEELFYNQIKWGATDLIAAFDDALQDAQTVDAVEVVRCKDCTGKAHWYKNDYGCTICGLSGLFVVEDKDYCSYGERRKNEQVS